jgi:aspartyl/asparaginyl-tRNA synthetase
VKWSIDLQLAHERQNGRTMDASAPGIGEIIGGNQREQRLEVLDQSMAERIGGNHGRTLAG